MESIQEPYLLTLNPFAIRFTENFGIRWYGLAYLAGFIVAYLTMRWMAKRTRTLLRFDMIGDFVFAAALGTVVGGRLGYCLFYNPRLFLSFRHEVPFWGVLAVNEGGMASHGGIFGIVVACVLFSRRHKIPVLHLCDMTTLGGCAGVFFGRIANFVNGELVGRIAPPGTRWAVKFPQDIFMWPTYEPARVASLAPVVDRIGVSPDTWQRWSAYPSAGETWTALHITLGRIVDAVQSGNTAVIRALAPLLDARYPSQLIEAFLEGLFLFCMVLFVWRLPRKPGVVGGIYLSMYAVVRIFGEQYRAPDAHIGFQMFGATRGQLLSIGMLLLGLVVVVITERSSMPAVGGWLKPVKPPPEEAGHSDQ